MCPAWFADSLSWVGISFTNEVPVPRPGTLGKRYNFDATPHSEPPYCPHASGNAKCEQLKACQNPRGPDFWMLNHAWVGYEPCDKHSDNPYKCHHVPQIGEDGPTEVCAVPEGDPPTSGRGRCVNKVVGP